MLKNKISILWLSVVLLTSGCSWLEVEPTYLVDAFYSTQLIDGDTLVAINGYAQSDFSMTSVRMYNEGEDFSYDLSALFDDGYAFEFAADSNDFVKDFEDYGLIYFEIEHEEDYSGLKADFVYDDLIYPFEISNVRPDTSGVNSDNAAILEWEDVENADFVSIYITRADTLVYNRVYIDGLRGSFKIKATDRAWINYYMPQLGDEFEVQMTAMMMEDATSYVANLQCITFSNTFSFTWSDE